MDCLCLNCSNHLHINKQSIINIAPIADSRICGPFGNSHIVSFWRACPFGIAQLFCVGFPANFAELIINQITCFWFRFDPLACCLVRLLLSGFLFNNKGCRCCLFGFFYQLWFLGLFALLITAEVFRYFRWHNKRLVLIVPISIGLHKPFT